MNDELRAWLSCPNDCDAPLDYEMWAYGFSAECEECGESVFWET